MICVKPSLFWKICTHTKSFRSPQEYFCRFMYITPSRASSDHLLLILNLPFKVILRRFEADVFLCLEWECCHFKRLMKIHSNPPILYNGFKFCPPELYFSILEGSRSLRSLNIQSLIWRAPFQKGLGPLWVELRKTHLKVFICTWAYGHFEFWSCF